jgi:hypothetical protein
LEEEVADDESVVCYVYESNKIKPDRKIHWKAFKPGSDGERSVFRIRDLTTPQIAQLGQREVGDRQRKHILGWGAVVAAQVRLIPLLLNRSEPPARHAYIHGWPDAPEKRSELAMRLASMATTTVHER